MKSHKLTLLLAVCLVITSMIVLAASGFAAELKQIRVKSFADRIEIVLDMDKPAEDLQVSQTNPTLVRIQFAGQLDPVLKNFSHAFDAHSNLKTLYGTDKGGKVQLFINRRKPLDINVYALKDPDRLVIRADEFDPDSQNGLIGPGIRHYQKVASIKRGRLNINVLDIDMNHPAITLEPVLAGDKLHGRARVATLASRYQAIAAINAAYFKPDTGTSLGALILNKELIAGPLYNRVSLGITADKKLKMARLGLKGSLTNSAGQSLPLHNVNQPRLNKHQYILYSNRWGTMAPNTPKNCMQIQINQGKITQLSQERLNIPQDGYVVVGPADGMAQYLQLGEPITINAYTVPDWSNVVHAISGGPYLVRDGRPYVDLKAQYFRPGAFTKPAPRTAVGFTANNHLLMVTVDGRQKNVSVGVTLSEMANIMRSLGAVEAMNFDGGSSTQMVVRGRVVNSPTVAGGAPVSTSLLVRQVPSATPVEVIGEGSPREPNRTHF